MILMNTFNWYQKYKLDIIIDNNNIKDYIHKLTNINIANNLNNKINTMEENYNNKIKEYMKIILNHNEYISKIKNKSCLFIIQQELDIIKILTKYTLENKILDLNFYIPCLNLLLELSEILRIQFNQKEIINNNINNNLYRCSYNFCNYKDNCNFYYNTIINNKKKCYQDHYVHNMVSNDIKILLDYINKNKNNNGIILYNKDVLKTINTLSFVINHMEIELRNKSLYLSENAILSILQK
jgi:hypothetical protein